MAPVGKIREQARSCGYFDRVQTRVAGIAFGLGLACLAAYHQFINRSSTCASTQCWPKSRPFSHEDFVFMLPGKT